MGQDHIKARYSSSKYAQALNYISKVKKGKYEYFYSALVKLA